MMKAIEVTDPEFTDSHWQGYSRLLEELHVRYNSFYNRLSWEQKKRQILSVYEIDDTQHRIIISDNNLIKGWLDFYIHNKGTESELAYIGFDGLYDVFPNDFTQLAASTLLQLSEKHNCRKLYIMSSNQRSSQVVRSWGGSEVCLFNRYELRREDTDLNLLTNWKNNGQKNNPDLSMMFSVEVPEGIIEHYVTLARQCLNDMPRENKSETQFLPTVAEVKKYSEWRKKNNKVMYSMMLFNPENQIIGFTDISISKDDPKNVFQLLTGIERQYRGRKLSNWLKAEMIIKIGEDFPENEIITTDMRAVNAPIQRVNEQLGYKLVSEGNEFDITVKELKNWLA